MNLEKTIKKLRNLSQYKNLSEEEINKIAQERLDKDEILGSLTFCINDEERKFAQTILENYLAQSSFENFSERQTLGQLIDQELLAKRMKEKLKTEYNTANPAICLDMVERLDKVVERIEELKEKLGLTRKENEINNAAQIIEDLKLRFNKWINIPENRSNYTFQCFKCGQTVLIRRRLDKEKDEVREHPWFIEGGILFNKEIFIDLNDKKITEEQAARYLDCSIEYLKWIKDNYPLSEDKEIEKEDV